MTIILIGLVLTCHRGKSLCYFTTRCYLGQNRIDELTGIMFHAHLTEYLKTSKPSCYYFLFDVPSKANFR